MKKSFHQYYFYSVFTTNFGNSIHFIVSGKLLFDFSGLVGAFASLVVLEHIKSISLSAYAGVLTDRYSGKRVAVVSDLILASIGLIVTSSLCLGLTNAWAAVVTAIGAFCINATKPFYRVATFAMVRSVAPDKKYFEFNTRAAFFQQSGSVFGLFVAGVLLNYFQPATILFFDAASYLLSALCLAKVTPIREPKPLPEVSAQGSDLDVESTSAHKGQTHVEVKSILRELSEVVRFCRVHREIAWLIFSIASLLVLLDLYGIFLFKLVGDRFSLQPSVLPLCAGIYAGGIAFLTIMTHRFSWFRKTLPSPVVSLLILALIFVCIGQSYDLATTGCCVALMSVVFSSLFSNTTSKLYASIPSDISGRIAGFRGVTLGVVGIPIVAMGSFLADRVNLQSAYNFAAVLALALLVPLNRGLKDSTREAYL